MISLVVLIIALGLLATAVAYAPIPAPFRGAAIALLCVLAAVWLLSGAPGVGLGLRLRD